MIVLNAIIQVSRIALTILPTLTTTMRDIAMAGTKRTCQSFLSQERIRNLLDYDPETGVFTWKVTRGPARPGKVAGSFSERDGYVHLGIDRVVHGAHRIAWLMVYGELPKFEIDHRDGNRSNNAINNLRDVPPGINLQNLTNPHVDNKSGFLGVVRSNAKKPSWTASIWFDGKKMHLGSFPSPELAHQAYVDAKRKHHAGCTL